MKYFKTHSEFLNEAKLSTIHKAAKKGSYPVSIVVIKDGKVIAQELVKTPAEVPAAFNVIQSYHKHKGATVHVESKTGERLFSESAVNEFGPMAGSGNRNYGSNDLVDRIGELDDILMYNRKAEREWEKISQNYLDDGFDAPYWSDLSDQELQAAIDDAESLMKKYRIKESESVNESNQARLTHLRKFGIAPNNQPQTGAYIKQVAKPGKFFVDWKDAFDLGDVALEFIKSAGSESVFDIIDLKTMKRTGKQYFIKKGDLKNLRTTYGVRVNESITEGKFNKRSLMKAMKKDDGMIQLGNGQEYVIYNPNNGNDDNADMWQDKVIFGLDQDGEEHEIEYSDIVRYDESAVTEATDLNDPVLVAYRATRKELPKFKPTKAKSRRLSFDKYMDLLDARLDVDQQIKDLRDEMAQTLRDMEQEAEPEGGEVADRYGSTMMKQEKEYTKLMAKKDKIMARIDKHRMA